MPSRRDGIFVAKAASPHIEVSDELQKYTTYSAGVAAKTSSPELARTFSDFVTRPAFRPKFAAGGLELYTRGVPLSVEGACSRHPLRWLAGESGDHIEVRIVVEHGESTLFGH